MKVGLSVVVPIRNEAANLPRCLASVHWAAEVFVVDSHSTDGSPALAAALGAKVVQFDFHGTWPKKKNWALENLPFHHEWVFILDADEVLPPEAEEEIRRLVTAPANDFAGYWINRRFNFLGQWLRHAYYPNWNLRLFRHRLGRFEKLTEADTASGDNEVHEHVVVRGRTGRLRCELDHYAFPSIAVFVEKHNRYSNWEAQVALEPCRDGSGVNLQISPVNWRRRVSRWAQRLPGRPWLRFLYVYVFQRGFLDGWAGFYFARLHACYEFLCVAKIYELRRQQAPAANGGAREPSGARSVVRCQSRTR